MNVACKIWLDHNGKAFGEGPCELLKRVEETNSLHEAAHQMDMSYSKAWCLIRTLEERLGFILLERKVGGISGGGSQLTPEAKNLMKHYGRFHKDVEETLEKLYLKHFGQKRGQIWKERKLSRLP